MNTKRFIPFLLIVAIAIFGCKQDKVAELNKLRKQRDELTDKIKLLEKETDNPEKEKKSLQVSVSTIQPTQFKHYLEIQGRLDGEDNVDVFPEAQGVVTEVLVGIGQTVSHGQALARLDVGPAKDQLKAIETQYKFASETYEKQKRLWDQKIGSEIQYLQAKAAKEQLESQKAGILKQIDMMTIKAPIAGTVEEVNVKLGQFASAASPIPPFRVLNFGSLKVKADVAEAYSKRVNVGDEVLVFFPDLNKEITAKVSTASRFISPTNRTFTIEVRLAHEKNGFKANMVAVLKITDYAVNNAIVIPINYVQSDPNGLFVYVSEPKGNKNIAKRVDVTEGQSYNGMVEITKGLTSGQKVITSGYLDLEEGETITF